MASYDGEPHTTNVTVGIAIDMDADGSGYRIEMLAASEVRSVEIPSGQAGQDMDVLFWVDASDGPWRWSNFLWCGSYGDGGK